MPDSIEQTGQCHRCGEIAPQKTMYVVQLTDRSFACKRQFDCRKRAKKRRGRI